jgi:sterol desaturase/sphingolipid hydroxylase (fatty acid hydroxylase superfamily)
MGGGLKKVIYQLGLLGLSILAILNLWKPLYEQGLVWFANSSSGSEFIRKFHEFTGYDILQENMLNMWMVSGFGGYLTMGIICGICDILLPIHSKTQQSRSYFTPTEWIHAVSVSLFNLFVSSWIVSLPYAYLKKSNPYIDPVSSNEEFVLYVEVIKFALSVFIVEVWFYCTHWLLHQPPFYSFIHKIHHRFKAPIAVASMYAHPIEFVVGNLLGVVLGPMITRCHPLTSYIWIHNALMSTGGSHSGYKMFYAEFHDAHHQYFDYNFGIGESDCCPLPSDH